MCEHCRQVIHCLPFLQITIPASNLLVDGEMNLKKNTKVLLHRPLVKDRTQKTQNTENAEHPAESHVILPISSLRGGGINK